MRLKYRYTSNSNRFHFLTSIGHRAEETSIDIIHFLQPLYLAYLISISISVYRCIFYNEDKTGKVGLSFVVGKDGINREVIHFDTQLIKATQLVTTFFMFYLAPTWMSCFIYFITYRLCLLGGMTMMKHQKSIEKAFLMVEEASKSKIE